MIYRFSYCKDGNVQFNMNEKNQTGMSMCIFFFIICIFIMQKIRFHMAHIPTIIEIIPTYPNTVSAHSTGTLRVPAGLTAAT